MFISRSSFSLLGQKTFQPSYTWTRGFLELLPQCPLTKITLSTPMHPYFFILSQAKITKIGKEIHSGRKRSWLITMERLKLIWLKTVRVLKHETRCLLCHWMTSSKGVVWSLWMDGWVAETFGKYGGFYFQLYRKYCPFLSDEHLAMVRQITVDYRNSLSLELNVNITHFQLPENAVFPSLPHLHQAHIPLAFIQLPHVSGTTQCCISMQPSGCCLP